MRTLLPVLLWVLHVLGWTVLEDTLDRSNSIICKHLCPAYEAAEEIAEEIAGVIAGFETLDRGSRRTEAWCRMAILAAWERPP